MACYRLLIVESPVATQVVAGFFLWGIACLKTKSGLCFGTMTKTVQKIERVTVVGTYEETSKATIEHAGYTIKFSGPSGSWVDQVYKVILEIETGE